MTELPKVTQHFELCKTCEGDEGWHEKDGEWHSCLDCEGEGGWWIDDNIDESLGNPSPESK